MGIDLLRHLDRNTIFSKFAVHLPEIHEETIFRTDNIGNKKKPSYIIEWPRSQFVFMKPEVKDIVRSKNTVPLNIRGVTYYEIKKNICDGEVNDGNILNTRRFKILRDYFAISSVIELGQEMSNISIELLYRGGETDMDLFEETLTDSMIEAIQFSEEIYSVVTGPRDFWTKIPSHMMPVLAEHCPGIVGTDYKKTDRGVRNGSVSKRRYILTRDLVRFNQILDTSYDNMILFVDNQELLEKISDFHFKFNSRKEGL